MKARYFIFGLVLGLTLTVSLVKAQEVFLDMSEQSIIVLNDELRKIKADIRSCEARLTAHGI